MNTATQQPAPRRSLTAAIAATSSLPQEALDLIRAGTPQPKTANPVIVQKPTAPEAPPAAAAPSEVSTPVVAPAAEIPSPEKAPRTVVRAKAKVEETEEVVSLVQDTFRLPGKYLEALAAAGFQRKTKRLRPFTKQDMMATALADWLVKEGFLQESDR